MGPIDILKDYAKDNPFGATIIFGGLALFAAAAVVTNFGVSLQSSVPFIVYILVVGVVFWLAQEILKDPVIKIVLKYFMATLACLWVCAFVASRFYPKWEAGACAVYFWTPCSVVADRVAEETAPPTPPPAVEKKPAAASPVPIGNFQVFIQFAGYVRDDVKALAARLVAAGWQVQGAAAGGERTGQAAGLNEVRYKSDRAAAEALAQAVASAGMAGRPIAVRQLDIIRPGVLELWISQ